METCIRQAVFRKEETRYLQDHFILILLLCELLPRRMVLLYVCIAKIYHLWRLRRQK